VSLLAVAGVLAVVLAIAVVIARLPDLRPRLTGVQAREIIVATLQRESREAFVITGSLDITATTRVQNVRRLLPGLLDLSLGTVESRVRAPGRVSYGFPIAAIEAASIRLIGDTIEMRVPDPRVYSVEPALQEMEVETTSGWLRLRGGTQAAVQQRATELIATTLRRQAESHLAGSTQPRINTAEALHELLRPSFQAADIAEPVFRFILSDNLVYRSDR
jgi:hypothetical protein